MDASGRFLDENVLGELLYGYSGLNLGIDFGAISPKIVFLHLGLKVSDLAVFNIPLHAKMDFLRYALDFDFGVYAEHTFKIIFSFLVLQK